MHDKSVINKVGVIEGAFNNALSSIAYNANKYVDHATGDNAIDPNGFPRAANNYTGPSFPEKNITTYAAAKSIYDSLSPKEKKWVCPYGKFIDSPYLAYRRVLAIHNPNKPGYGIPIAFCEMYEFPARYRELELVLATRPGFRSDHAALQLLNEAAYAVDKSPDFDKILIRVNNDNAPMLNMMNNKLIWSKMNISNNRIVVRKVDGCTEYLLNFGPLNESTDMIDEAVAQPYKSYPNTYVGQKITAGGQSIEKPLIDYIMKAERINKSSEAFKQIQSDIKTRQTSAILYRVLMMPNVVLAIADRELPASFKVFRAADVRAADKSPKVFIDLTGIVKLVSGNLVCSKIDTLITYLTGALVQLLYYDGSRQLTTNASVTRPATTCFVKLFTGVIDELRIIGYAENQLKIKYAVAVYFLTSLVGKPIENARNLAANILGIAPKDAKAFDYFYSDEAMENLNTFVTDLCENFKLKGFGTDTMLDRWMFKYGNGTMYGLELYPSFLTMLTNAYCGTYVNNQKTIEKYCGRDMVTVSTTIIRMGADIFSEGAHYVRKENGEIDLR